MSISLKKSGMLKLGLSLVAMTVAASVQAKTLVYCSEGSPEGFNPQLFTSGTTYDASSVPIYNRLVEFKTGTTKLFQDLLRNGKSVRMAKPILFTSVRV
ncbi:periplasmic dipeptide transport protein [Klebsiella pneumoniae]|uniref:Periplasmic dipeptide transport protein n=1 Tax=Klebsiella pneumoniae TaxID=573 RepID=A0A2X3EB77_KLEPN|nr:periplasmic dipeptide transport protein [Klebsiella pneumoniae]